MPIVEDCMKCLSLKKGTILTGILNLIVVLAWAGVEFGVCPNVSGSCCRDNALIVQILHGVFAVIWIVAAILLLVGCCKENRWFILPWLILYVHMIIASFDYMLCTGIDSNSSNCAVWIVIVWIVPGVLFPIFDAYLWVVVLSYYQVLRG